MKLSEIEKHGISPSEALATIAHCERTGGKMQDSDTGLYTGSRQLGHITLWAEYHVDDVGEIMVANVYYNRSIANGPTDTATMKDLSANPAYHSMSKRDMRCCKCNVAPDPMKVMFRYLNFDYVAVGFVCPQCGLLYMTEDAVDLQRNTIERILESK
jgi:hypothetical protein